MAWMETDYSKHSHFQWKIKWPLEHLGTLGIMGETAPLRALGRDLCLRDREGLSLVVSHVWLWTSSNHLIFLPLFFSVLDLQL